jgi:hypothetical protein
MEPSRRRLSVADHRVVRRRVSLNRRRYAAYASGLAVLGVLVGLLKLAGAAVALAAVLVPPGLAGRPRQLLGIALRGAAAAGAAAAVAPAILGWFGLLPT